MPEALRVLFASSEVQPLVKTGGLADVSGALPPALRELGADARILLPGYPGVAEGTGAAAVTEDFEVLAGLAPVRILAGTLPDRSTPVYVVHAPNLYHRDTGPYLDAEGRDYPDNWLRFALLSRVAALFGEGSGLASWRADVVHANDWQTGLAPAYLAFAGPGHARSVFSVHNLAFQGNFPPHLMTLLQLPPAAFSPDGLEFYGRVSYLKAALHYADRLTTVSPTYAREIQTAELGFGMEGVLRARRNVLDGILNGVNQEVWNPRTDPHLARRYGPDTLESKAVNRDALRARLGLAPDPEAALLGLVTRLTWQKGIDLVLDAVEALLDEPLQLAVLGSGEPRFEERLRALASRRPGQIGLHIGYDEELAHLIEAGSDLFLMPSRFEPCGLNQMYSMRYGTPPVVRRTGGLADSVTDATPRTLDAGTATGFVLDAASPSELRACLIRALLLRRDADAWRRLQRAGMARDWGWERSAREYLDVYAAALGSGGATGGAGAGTGAV